MGRPRKVKQTTQENILQNEPQPLLSLSGLNDQILNEKPDEKLQASIVLSRSKLSESQSPQSPLRDLNNTRSFNTGSLLNSPISNNSLSKKQLQPEQIQQQLLNNTKIQYKKINTLQILNILQQIKQKLDIYISNVENQLSSPEEKSWRQMLSLNKNGNLQNNTIEILKNTLNIDYEIQTKNTQQINNIQQYTQHIMNFNSNNVKINVRMLYNQLIILKNTLMFLPNPYLIEQNINTVVNLIITWKQLLYFFNIHFNKNIGPIKQINQLIEFLYSNIFQNKQQQDDIQKQQQNININDFENNIKQFISVAQKFIKQISINQSYEQQRYYCQKCIAML